VESGINDLVIIGGGLAGLAAAARATELGLSVLVLEAGADADYMCNSRITGGIFHVAMNDIQVGPTEARANIEAATRGHADPALADALAGNAKRTVDWLRTQGIRFIKGGPTPEFSTVLAPPRLQQFGMHWKGRGGDVLLRTLAERIAARGGRLERGVRAMALLVEEGRIAGVDAERDGARLRFGARAVLIADGGFQADPELVGAHISPAPEKVRQRNAQTGRGDGLRMAEAVGAKLSTLDCFYGHVLHRDAMFNEQLWPHPMIDSMAVSGLIVDGEGNRFTDEGLGGVSIANAIARMADPLSAIVICDDAAWQGPAREAVLAPNPNLERAGGAVTRADDLDTLAVAVGLPPGRLAATVQAYNAAVAAGTADALSPPRTAARVAPMPIQRAPFHAVPVCAGLTYTMGGIAIDGEMRVLDRNDAPIPGLFAAGAATGGLEGGPFTGYTGGLSKASVFGLLAAETIAREAGPALRATA